jgi:hypothetical protein
MIMHIAAEHGIVQAYLFPGFPQDLRFGGKLTWHTYRPLVNVGVVIVTPSGTYGLELVGVVLQIRH